MSKTPVPSTAQTFRFDPAELKIISSKEVPSEHEEQRAFISWWRKSFGDDCRIFAIPNGEARGIAAARRLKAEGVTKGVPDLFAPTLCLWIEFKRQSGGRLSAEQADWRDHLIGCGYRWILAKGAADAVNQVSRIVKPSP
jgi:hypothetical protein